MNLPYINPEPFNIRCKCYQQLLKYNEKRQKKYLFKFLKTYGAQDCNNGFKTDNELLRLFKTGILNLLDDDDAVIATLYKAYTHDWRMQLGYYLAFNYNYLIDVEMLESGQYILHKLFETHNYKFIKLAIEHSPKHLRIADNNNLTPIDYCVANYGITEMIMGPGCSSRYNKENLYYLIEKYTKLTDDEIIKLVNNDYSSILQVFSGYRMLKNCMMARIPHRIMIQTKFQTFINTIAAGTYPVVFSLRLMCLNVIYRNREEVNIEDSFPKDLLRYKYTDEWEKINKSEKKFNVGIWEALERLPSIEVNM